MPSKVDPKSVLGEDVKNYVNYEIMKKKYKRTRKKFKIEGSNAQERDINETLEDYRIFKKIKKKKIKDGEIEEAFGINFKL